MTVLLKLMTTWFVAFIGWLVISALVAVPTALIWNWIVPAIFGLPEIGFGQAFGLLILNSLLLSARKVDVRMNE